MLHNQITDIPRLTDIYATLNPGGHTARVDSLNPDGMTLRYVTIEDSPPLIEEVVMLVNGYVQRLGKDDFTVVSDQELKNARSNGYRLRRVQLRARGGIELEENQRNRSK